MNSYDSIISLSLGTAAEPSGLVVVTPWSSMYPPDGLAPGAGVGNRFSVTWIERFPAGRPLPAILNRVSEVASDKRVSRESIILLDITSVGTAPLRAFQTRGMYPAAIDLTNAGTEGFTNDSAWSGASPSGSDRPSRWIHRLRSCGFYRGQADGVSGINDESFRQIDEDLRRQGQPPRLWSDERWRSP